MTETITLEGMDELAKKFEQLNKVAPDYCYNAVQSAGTALRKDVIARTRGKVKTHTGHLISGYVRRPNQKGSGSNRQYWCDISGGNKHAQHFHLVENGHVRKEQYVNLDGHYAHITAGFTQGYGMMKETKDSWRTGNKFVPYCEKAIKKAVKKGLL